MSPEHAPSSGLPAVRPASLLTTAAAADDEGRDASPPPPPDTAVLAGRAADPDADVCRWVRTGEQVVEWYAQYGQDSPVTFFFCKRDPAAGLRLRPYDLVVVRREAAGDDYYTVSATGVMHMRRGVRAGADPAIFSI